MLSDLVHWVLCLGLAGSEIFAQTVSLQLEKAGNCDFRSLQAFFDLF